MLSISLGVSPHTANWLGGWLDDALPGPKIVCGCNRPDLHRRKIRHRIVKYSGQLRVSLHAFPVTFGKEFGPGWFPRLDAVKDFPERSIVKFSSPVKKCRPDRFRLIDPQVARNAGISKRSRMHLLEDPLTRKCKR